MRKVLVLNGPNLDMLGLREPEVYGRATLADLESEVTSYAESCGIEVTCSQSNSEGRLIERIHAARTLFDGIVYNPGAHTHYSYALRDAVASIDIPVVEVHLSDVANREAFRRVSVVAPACIAQVKGLGVHGYCKAIDILREEPELVRLGEGYERGVQDGQQVIRASSAQGERKGYRHAESSSGESGTAEASALSGYTSADDTLAFSPVKPIGRRSNSAPLFGNGALASSSMPGSDEGDARNAGDARDANGANNARDARAAGDAHAARDANGANNGRDAHAAGDARVTGTAGTADDAGVLSGQAVGAAPATEANGTVDRRDFTEPYAAIIASVDAGMLSFERQSVVQSSLGRLGLSSLLVRDTANIQWITAFDRVFDEERAHGLLLDGGRAFLHTDGRYANAIRMAAAQTGSDVMVNEDRMSHAQFAFNVLTQGGQVPLHSRLGIEDSITYAEFVKMVEKFQTSGLAPTTDVVLSLRAVKDTGEVMRMKAAQAVTDAAFSHIVGYMRPGMTERDVQLELESFMMRHGGEALSFRSIVATGPNGADPHAVPGDTRLEAGQCVVMDFGAKAYGYCSDMTRTVFLGRPEGLMLQAWETLRRANEAVEALLRPGVTGAYAHRAAEQVLSEGGFAGTMGHGLGHGVGLEVHELPVLNMRNETPLVEGNVVTVEPGIYLPGQFGMRLEDFGVVTSTGFEVFTQSTHEMVII